MRHSTDHALLPATRDRLLLAFADLASYGITALPAMPGHPDTLREYIPAAVRDQFPAAMGSFIFWTAAADQCSFDPVGELTATLELHHSGHDVQRAAAAALTHVGLAAAAANHPPRLTIRPALTAHMGSAPDHRAATSALRAP